MNTVTIKRGDTLVLTGVYKQSNGTVMNLTGYVLEINILNSNDRTIATIKSNSSTSNRSVVVTDAVNGAFTLVVKDTDVLREDDYYIDFKAVGSNGYEQTSKALRLKIKNKLV